jgi:hypothetical protein
LFYFREAIGIARFDDAPILGASRDPGALAWRLLIWAIGSLLIYSRFLVAPIRAASKGYTVHWALPMAAIVVAFVIDAITFVVQDGLTNVQARWWFGVGGTFEGIARAMLLGSIVTWLYPIPVMGTLGVGLWMIAILMRVFEEVDGIERLKALASPSGSAWVFSILGLTLAGLRR